MDSHGSLKRFQERLNNQCKHRYYELKQQKLERKISKISTIDIVMGCIQNNDEEHVKSSLIHSDDNLSKNVEETKLQTEHEDVVIKENEEQAKQIKSLEEEEKKIDENALDQSAKPSNLAGMKKVVIRNKKKERVIKPKLPKRQSPIKKKKKTKKELKNMLIKEELGQLSDTNFNQFHNANEQREAEARGLSYHQMVKLSNLTEKGDKVRNTSGNVAKCH
jgi:hypothetical protein